MANVNGVRRREREEALELDDASFILQLINCGLDIACSVCSVLSGLQPNSSRPQCRRYRLDTRSVACIREVRQDVWQQRLVANLGWAEDFECLIIDDVIRSGQRGVSCSGRDLAHLEASDGTLSKRVEQTNLAARVGLRR